MKRRGSGGVLWGMEAATIVRIVKIEDTREYEEQGDRWVPIPGSGEARDCSRCGRSHEIHATVELVDGSTTVVGTGCAARESADLAPAFRSGESRAKRVKALRAELARALALVSERDTVVADVAAMQPPAVDVSVDHDAGRYRGVCGDAFVFAFFRHEHDFHSRAVAAWRARRVAERGINYRHDIAAISVRDLPAKIAKIAGAN